MSINILTRKSNSDYHSCFNIVFIAINNFIKTNTKRFIISFSRIRDNRNKRRIHIIVVAVVY
jgi:hypothetical protein